MSSIFLNIYDRCDKALCVCDEVVITLDTGWEAKTVSGVPFIYGRIFNISSYVVPTLPYTNQSLCTTVPSTTTNCIPIPTTQITNPCCCTPAPAPATSPCPMCIYQVEIDNTQLNIDSETGLPYALACSDVIELVPCKATFVKLLALITGS